MRTGGDFHKDLEKDLKGSTFSAIFRREKSRLHLAERLRKVMLESRLSIRRIAHLMGTSKSQVMRMISDPEANVGLDSLIKFTAVVGRRLEITIK